MSAETVDLHVIARREPGQAAVDLFGREVFFDAETGSELGPAVELFWESLPVPADAPAGAAGLDATLTAAGYQRTGEWRRRVTAAGAVRYFTTATIHISE
ncbi:hypothetical protein ACFYTF_28940 [Nocardia thailandica]|uniref:Uncharacterized protein n=1 Tax=Nocardia thailandica TaxID=257275 RepID=A0ABW6PXJ7_9NOCA